MGTGGVHMELGVMAEEEYNQMCTKLVEEMIHLPSAYTAAE